MQEPGFALVISVVCGQEDSAGADLLREPPIARSPSGGFQAFSALCGLRLEVGDAVPDEGNLQLGTGGLHKGAVVLGRLPEPVVHMQHGEERVDAVRRMEQGHGVQAAGDSEVHLIFRLDSMGFQEVAQGAFGTGVSGHRASRSSIPARPHRGR